MGTREATHAGSWYTGNGQALARQLDEWLSQVPDEISGLGKIPDVGSRAIISPYANSFHAKTYELSSPLLITSWI